MDLVGQKDLEPKISDHAATTVYVVTDRLIDTLDNGRLIFTNIVDTAQSLKYILVSLENDGWYCESYGSFDDLLANPAPYHDWAIWVHGDGQSFLPCMMKALEIQELHRVNLIVFSWPTKSSDKGPIGSFRNSMVNAGLTVPYLAEMCRIVQAYREKPGNRMVGENLTIFFHSLGNYLLHKTFDGGNLAGLQPGLFDNLVINSAVIDSEGHNHFIETLNFQKRIYITSNARDKNLRGLRILTSFDLQLGERPVPPLASNAKYIDFSTALRRYSSPGTTHSYYYARVTEKSKNIRQFYTDIFHGKEIDFNNAEMFDKPEGNGMYQIKF